MTSPQCAQLSGWNPTQAAQPAKNVQASAIGNVTDRHRSVRTGWTNFSGRNIARASVATRNNETQKFGSSAKMTSTTMFQHPGKPEKESNSSVDPLTSLTYMRQGSVLMQQGRFEQALEAFEQVIDRELRKAGL